MKPLEKFINIEKARLLHQLFPQEIPALLDFVLGMCQTIKENEAIHRTKWDNGLFSFNFWMSLLEDVEKRSLKYGTKLHGISRLFADQLFEGYLAMYMVHCLIVYTTTRQHPNRKFALAIDLLFNP
jgi:hypothetical protein